MKLYSNPEASFLLYTGITSWTSNSMKKQLIVILLLCPILRTLYRGDDIRRMTSLCTEVTPYCLVIAKA